jgi:hypothetical protein
MAVVSYTRMADMTEADLQLVNADIEEDARELPDRLMNAIAELEQFQGPVKVSRLEHSLQSATRAHHAGKDNEYVAAVLIHDIGDALAPYSHGEMVAGILRPFVSERICWIVEKHALFQSYYYAHLGHVPRLGVGRGQTESRRARLGRWIGWGGCSEGVRNALSALLFSGLSVLGPMNRFRPPRRSSSADLLRVRR